MQPLIISLFLAQFCNVVDFMMIMPLGPVFMRDFHIDPQHFGLLVSVYTFACSAAGILSFAVLDRFDRRKLFLGTFIFFLFSNLLCASATSYHTLLFGRIISGLSGGLLEAAVFTLVGDLFPAEKRGAVTGKIIAAFSLSSLIGVPLGLFVAAQLSWRFVFIFVALLATGGIITAWTRIPSSTAHLELSGDHSLQTLLKDKRSVLGLLFFSTSMVSIFLVVPFLASSLVFNGGVPENRLFIAYAAGGLASIISTPAIGKLADRWGAWKTYIYFAPLGSLVLGGILLFKNVGVVEAAIALAFSMSLNGGRAVAAMTIINSIPPPRYRAAYLSLKSTAQYAAGGLASLVAGYLVTTSASGNLIGLNTISILNLIFTLISIPLAYCISASPKHFQLESDTHQTIVD